MPDSPEIIYADNLETLTSILEDLERPGDYHASGTIDAAPPLLEVEDVGVVSFPVPPEQARALAASAEQAPYGRGAKTLVDESVRKVRQIAPSKVRLGGKQWPTTLDSLLEEATAGLGRPEGSLTAELYKLLVYEKDGFFLAHRDTEKAPGMLGTLIVVLPSAHEGGELIVRHDGRETVLDLRSNDPGELRYAAFYADCEHEVRPVTRGHRICLVYNLVMADRSEEVAPGAPDTRCHVEAVADTLREWGARDDRAYKIVYLLEHRYTEAALSFDALKGPDAIRAEVLRDAVGKAGFALHLGMVHIEESGAAEYSGDFHESYRRRRRWDDDWEDEGEDSDEFEVGEVFDYYRYVSNWRDTEDRAVEFGQIPLEEGETLPVGALDGEEADETHFSEASGNAGASFERTYLRAALVLWSHEDFDIVCASGGVKATLARLEQRVEESLRDESNHEAKDAVGKLAGLLGEALNKHSFRLPENVLEQGISTLVRFGNARLLEEHMLPPLNVAIPSDLKPLIDWARLAGPKKFAPVGEFIISPDAPSSALQCLQLWTTWAETWSQTDEAKKLLSAWLNPLFKKLEQKEEDPPPYRDTWWARTYFSRSEQPAPERCPPLLLGRFLRAAEALGDTDLAKTLKQACSQRELFPSVETIVPALEADRRGEIELPASAKDCLWRHAVETLLKSAAAPPAPPDDWTQPLTPIQRKQLPADLRKFALDPHQKVLRLQLRKELRQQIHQTIDRLGIDITHVTERKGRPYTLVLTKTLAHYKRACEQYIKDYNALCRLADLQAGDDAGSKPLQALLEKAIATGKGWRPRKASDVKPTIL